jgi:hypothetical protein
MQLHDDVGHGYLNTYFVFAARMIGTVSISLRDFTMSLDLFACAGLQGADRGSGCLTYRKRPDPSDFLARRRVFPSAPRAGSPRCGGRIIILEIFAAGWQRLRDMAGAARPRSHQQDAFYNPAEPCAPTAFGRKWPITVARK